jgi:UDP-N-acetylglucosamine 2-epimerase
MPRVLTMLGTRPEIIKLSPLIPLLDERFEHLLVHSGQHYSYEMDARFFVELGLPMPDATLNVGSASHGEQLARMLSRLEPLLLAWMPDAVVVQGDTNTALAGGLAAAKLNIPVVHIEAGCRSFNRHMPEELNRVMVDHMASLLCAPDTQSVEHLRAEGIPESQIALVGSTGVDACMRNCALVGQSSILADLGLTPGGFLILTLHRAENTAPEILPGLLSALDDLATDQTLIFPLHPRTAAAISAQGLRVPDRIRTCAPLGYIDMLRLLGAARAALTDSGGLQEEAAVLGVPSLILRNETEWQRFVDAGVHTLAGNRPDTISAAAKVALSDAGLAHARSRPLPLAGGASERICTLIGDLMAAHGRSTNASALRAIKEPYATDR